MNRQTERKREKELEDGNIVVKNQNFVHNMHLCITFLRVRKNRYHISEKL